MPDRRGAISELRKDEFDMKFGQPMIMHIPKKRGLDVTDINLRATRNAFHNTLDTIEYKKGNWAGERKGMKPPIFTR